MNDETVAEQLERWAEEDAQKQARDQAIIDAAANQTPEEMELHRLRLEVVQYQNANSIFIRDIEVLRVKEQRLEMNIRQLEELARTYWREIEIWRQWREDTRHTLTIRADGLREATTNTDRIRKTQGARP